MTTQVNETKNNPITPASGYLTSAQLCERLGNVSTRTLHRWQQKKTTPYQNRRSAQVAPITFGQPTKSTHGKKEKRRFQKLAAKKQARTRNEKAGRKCNFPTGRDKTNH